MAESRAEKIKKSLERLRDSPENERRRQELNEQRQQRSRNSGTGAAGGGGGGSSSSSSVDAPVVNDRAAAVFSGDLSVQDFQAGKPAPVVTAQVSSGVAGKLAQQSLGLNRSDVSFSASVSARDKTQSVDPVAQANNNFVGPRYQEKQPSKIQKAYDESFLSVPQKGVEYLLSTPDKRVARTPSGELNFFSDNPETQARVQRQFERENQGRQAAGDVLLLGAGFATLEPTPIGTSNARVASRSATKVVSSESASVSTSVVEGEAIVQQSILGIKLPERKAFFSGKVASKAEDTGFVGGVSKEPILKTSSEGKFDVTFEPFDKRYAQFGNDPKFKILTDSDGGSVGGVGQRRTGIAITTPGESRQLASGLQVETFVGKNTDDAVFGGVVSQRGVDVFANRKILETTDTQSSSRLVGRYVDPVTDLDYAGPNFAGKNLLVSEAKSERLLTTKVFEGGSLGDANVPFSASLTQKGAVDLLKRERAGKTRSGAVEFFKSSSDDGLVSSSKKELYTSQDFKFDTLLKKGLESATTPKVKLPSPNPQGLVSNSKSDSSIKPQDITTGPATVRYRTVLDVNEIGAVTIIPRNNIRQRSEPIGSVAPIQGVSSGLGFKSAVGGRSGQEIRPVSIAKPATNSLSGTEIVPRVLPKSDARPAQVQIQSFRFGSVNLTNARPVVFQPPMALKGGFNLPFQRKGGLFDVQVRRFGKFESVGRASSLSGAVRLGKSTVKTGLGATFRVKQGSSLVDVDAGSGFYKKGGLNIEKRNLRLNTGSEVGEINFFRTKKGKGGAL